MSRWRIMSDRRLDVVVAELVGRADGGAVEAVLAANPGLAALGPIVPAGTEIEVPTITTTVEAVGVRVWE